MEVIITKENFAKEVLAAKLPVIVDFFATWCGPCKMLAPTLEAYAKENAGKVIVAKVDIDANEELANEFRIEVVPTLIGFYQGEARGALKGLVGKKQLDELVRSISD